MSSAFYGIGQPPAAQGLVVQNATLDRATYADREDDSKDSKKSTFPFGSPEDHGIAPHEVCFTNRKIYGKRTFFNEPALKVFSSLNGMDRENAREDFPEKRYAFVGVSQTTISSPFDGNGHLSLAIGGARFFLIIFRSFSYYFSFDVSGLVRIFNTGKEDIEVGDKVCWEMPIDNDDKGRVMGMSTNKVYPMITPYEKTRAYSKILSDRRQELSLRARIIGTALSPAKRNQAFDILLGH